MGLNPRELTPGYIVDMFITDCTLPSTKKKVPFAEIKTVFETYCDQVGVAVPCGTRFLGKLLSNRFQKKVQQGYSYYFLEWRPGIFDVTT